MVSSWELHASEQKLLRCPLVAQVPGEMERLQVWGIVYNWLTWLGKGSFSKYLKGGPEILAAK